MFSMMSYTRIVTFVQIRQKIDHHVTLKILIGRFSRNLFSRTAEGIELKSGIYVTMNVLTCVVTVCAIWKFKMATSGGQSLHWNPMGKQHFHLLLENSRTEFNQTWQRCFLWGPKKLSWFVLTRPTHWALSLVCIGKFVMPIILTWVLFCSKCAELLLDQEKQRVTNLKDGPRFFWDHILPTAHVNSSFIISQSHTNDDP